MKGNFVLVDAGLFCIGMNVKAPIYYLNNGNYVLLCDNTVFTKELCEKLFGIEKAHGGLFVEEKNYKSIWYESLKRYTKGSEEYKKAFEEVKGDYKKILSSTTDFIVNMTTNKSFEAEAAEKITSDIAKDLNVLDQSMVLRCINVINATDDYLYTHSVNVASLNGLIGRWMNLSSEEINDLILVGLLHDFGKLKVPSEILNKPAKLDEKEFIEIKKHPVYSYEMLKNSNELSLKVLEGIKHHHERPNGTGYPDGVSGDAVSLYARITAVSDVYDAMVSKRCYKDEHSPFEILAQLQESRFSNLDVHIVNIFLKNITYLFVGMKVLLSNGKHAEVLFISPNDFANPVVKIGEEVITTGDDLKCISAESSF